MRINKPPGSQWRTISPVPSVDAGAPQITSAPRLAMSTHGTSIVPASSTAESRVGSTTDFASDFAPIAAASVNVAGSATGIEPSAAVNISDSTAGAGRCRTTV